MRSTKYLFVLIFITFNINLNGQHKTLIENYLQKIDTFKYVDYNEIYDYAIAAYNLSLQTKDTFYLGRTAKELGAYYIFKGKQDSALYYTNQAFKFSNTAKDSLNLSLTANNLGVIYQNMANYDSAYKYFMISYNINIATDNKKELIADFNNLGMLYYVMNNYPKAIENFTIFLNMALENNDSTLITEAYINLALTFNQLDKYNYALDFLNKSLRYTGKNIYKKVKILDNLGITYAYLENYKKAKEVLDISYKIKLKYGFLSELIQSHLYYAEYFAMLSEFDSLESHLADAMQLCFETKNLRLTYYTLTMYGLFFREMGFIDKAIAYLINAEEIATNAKAYNYLLEIYQNLADLYVSVENYQKAYEYQKKYTDLLLVNDTIREISPPISNEELDNVNQATVFKNNNFYLFLILGILMAITTLLIINLIYKNKH
ncbi:MAG: tetratricopeptide repeat protein [Bacteroidales bacterium]|jgi:adenylate cyclase|nr:tetratricopeptide repeat protein [Bacteroidales bacterium]MDI9575919.1 tetratricopeptide repeat protein [Bacteroidota bacterium]MDY0400921.1 tetratricopeptide repeat protein [Bacteroidales bacterium]HHW59751.1 tetratricopeptide repeat protein [Bacteroidales bacterium]HOB77677.1 tetratricopeptide repeat protein [Bacteroidales bacterium]